MPATPCEKKPISFDETAPASVLAIDPGSKQSAFVILDAGRVRASDKLTNEELLEVIPILSADYCAIEMIASYGMAVGAEVFETCVWIGRFSERWFRSHGADPDLVYRKDVKLRLCGSPRAKDPNIRQALIDKFGGASAVGKKKSPGPLFGIAGDRWAALGVAVTWAEAREELINGKE